MTAITQIISNFPVPLPNRDLDTPSDFSDHVNSYIDHINIHISEENTWAEQANDLSSHVDSQSDHVDSQSDHVDEQTTYVDEVSDHVDTVKNAIEDDIASAGVTGTSSTSLTIIDSGSISLTTQAGKNWAYGQRIKIVYSSDYNTYMKGTITSYDSSTGALGVDIHDYSGLGTYSAWSLFIIPDDNALVNPIGWF